MVFTLSSHDIEKFGLPRAQLKWSWMARFPEKRSKHHRSWHVLISDMLHVKINQKQTVLTFIYFWGTGPCSMRWTGWRHVHNCIGKVKPHDSCLKKIYIYICVCVSCWYADLIWGARHNLWPSKGQKKQGTGPGHGQWWRTFRCHCRLRSPSTSPSSSASLIQASLIQARSGGQDVCRSWRFHCGHHDALNVDALACQRSPTFPLPAMLLPTSSYPNLHTCHVYEIVL